MTVFKPVSFAEICGIAFWDQNFVGSVRFDLSILWQYWKIKMKAFSIHPEKQTISSKVPQMYTWAMAELWESYNACYVLSLY